MKLREILITIAGVIVLFVITGLIVRGLVSGKSKKPMRRGKQQTFVQTMKVSQPLNSTMFSYSGRVSSPRKVSITSEAAGKLQKGNIPLRAGQSFKKNQLLYSIDSRSLVLSIRSSRSDYIKLVSSVLADLKIDHNQSYNTWKEYVNLLSAQKPLKPPPEFKNERTNAFLINKGIYTTFHKVKSEADKLRNYSYYTKFSGSITEVFSAEGSNLTPGTKVATIIETNDMEIEIPVPAHTVDGISIGNEVAISKEGKSIGKGKIIRKSSSIDPSTQSVSVYVVVTEGKVLDGDYVTVQGSAANSGQAYYSIPQSAIQQDSTVFIYMPDSTVQAIPIKGYQSTGDSISVTGVKNGQSLVIRSNGVLKTGMKVNARN